jgi:hypothetical protein
MSRKAIRRAGPELITESSVSFQKEPSGLFKRVEVINQRDINTSLIAETNTIESEERYRQTLDDDFDHEVVFQDIDGTEVRMRLKTVNPDEWKQ